MPLKNNHQAIPFYPGIQILGVLITAVTLAIITFHFETPIREVESSIKLQFSGLILSAVIAFYSADHIRDLLFLKMGNKKYKNIIIINSILFVFSSVYLFYVTVKLFSFIFHTFWVLLPIIGVLVYLLISQTKFPFIHGLKEVLIAFTVPSALLFPAYVYGWNGHLLNVFFVLMVVCFQNVILFSYFEHEKDELLGFKTMFSGFQKKQIIKIILGIYIVATIILIYLHLNDPEMGYGSLILSGLYWVLFWATENIKEKWILRILTDALLLLLLI